jgi:hypothetical protein
LTSAVFVTAVESPARSSSSAWKGEPVHGAASDRGVASSLHAVAERARGARRHGGNPRAPFGDLFNRDTVGLPQNETSISDCTSNPKVLLGGTNDYRGIIDPPRELHRLAPVGRRRPYRR